MSFTIPPLAIHSLNRTQSWSSDSTTAQQHTSSVVPRISAVSQESLPTVSTPSAISQHWEMGDFTVTNGSFLSQNNTSSKEQTAGKANQFIQDQLPSFFTRKNNTGHSLNTTSSSLAFMREMQSSRSTTFQEMVTKFSVKLDTICSDTTAPFGDLKNKVALEFKSLLCSFARTVSEWDRLSTVQEQIDEAIDLSVDAVELLASKKGISFSPQKKITERNLIKSQLQHPDFIQVATRTPLGKLLNLGQEAISDLPFSLPNTAPSSSSDAVPTYDPFFDDLLNRISSSSSGPVTTSEAPFPEVRSMAPSCSSGPVTTSEAPFPEVRSMAPSCSAGPVPTYSSDLNIEFEKVIDREETSSKHPQPLSASDTEATTDGIKSKSNQKSLDHKRKRARNEDRSDSLQPSSNKKMRYTAHKPVTIILERKGRPSDLSFHFRNPPQELTSLLTKMDTKKKRILPTLNSQGITTLKAEIKNLVSESIDAFMEEDSLILPPDMIEFLRYTGSAYDLLAAKQKICLKKTFSEVLEEFEKSLKKEDVFDAFLDKIETSDYKQIKEEFEKSKAAIQKKPLAKYLIRAEEVPFDLNFSDSTACYFGMPYQTVNQHAKNLLNSNIYPSAHTVQLITQALKSFIANIQSLPSDRDCDESLAEEITSFLTYTKAVYVLYQKLLRGNLEIAINKSFTKILKDHIPFLISTIGADRLSRLDLDLD